MQAAVTGATVISLSFVVTPPLSISSPNTQLHPAPLAHNAKRFPAGKPMQLFHTNQENPSTWSLYQTSIVTFFYCIPSSSQRSLK